MKTQKKLWSALAALCVATGTVAQPAYNYSKLQKEQLGRGVVAIRENPLDVVVSWRYLSSDPINTSFNVYRNGEKIAEVPNSTGTFYRDTYSGNEKAVSRVINELSAKGADVIFQDTHVSGHACQEEIKLIYTLVKPKYAIPVHGEYKHLRAQAKIAENLGIPKDDIFILSSGDVLEVSEEKARVTGKVPVGSILVDGLGVGDVGNIVLRDRQHLAEDGILIVVMALDRVDGYLVSGPDIVSRGFVYVRESDELMDEARQLVNDTLEELLDKGVTDWGKLKTATKDVLSDYVWKKTKRSPMILPIIMEV